LFSLPSCSDFSFSLIDKNWWIPMSIR
jgi:hypothetical protein